MPRTDACSSGGGSSGAALGAATRPGPPACRCLLPWSTAQPRKSREARKPPVFDLSGTPKVRGTTNPTHSAESLAAAARPKKMTLFPLERFPYASAGAPAIPRRRSPLSSRCWFRLLLLISALAAAQTDSAAQQVWMRSPSGPAVGHSDGITSVAFSPDGATLASGSWDKSIRLWHAADGAPRFGRTRHAGAVWSVRYSPSGNLVASAGDEGWICLWNATTGAEEGRLLEHANGVVSLSLSPDAQSLVSGASDGTIRLWR